MAAKIIKIGQQNGELMGIMGKKYVEITVTKMKISGVKARPYSNDKLP